MIIFLINTMDSLLELLMLPKCVLPKRGGRHNKRVTIEALWLKGIVDVGKGRRALPFNRLQHSKGS